MDIWKPIGFLCFRLFCVHYIDVQFPVSWATEYLNPVPIIKSLSVIAQLFYWLYNNILNFSVKGGLHQKPPKSEHIFELS